MKTVRDAIKQTKPFKSLREEMLLTLVRTAAEIEHQASQEFRAFGLTSTQYNVLRILRGAADEGLCRHEIGARLLRQVPDVTRLLDRMEEAGWIVRERGDADRRYVTTRLTPKGLALVDRLDSEIVAMHEKQAGHLTDKQMQTLIDLLEELRAGDQLAD